MHTFGWMKSLGLVMTVVAPAHRERPERVLLGLPESQRGHDAVARLVGW